MPKLSRAITPFLLLFIAFIAGCIAYSPQDVKETIKIGRDGKISATYEGTFNNLEGFIKSIYREKGEKFDVNEYRKQSFENLKQKDYLSDIYKIAPDTYHLKWHENTSLDNLWDTKLLSGNGDDEIPTFLRFTAYNQLSNNAYQIYSVTQGYDGADKQGYNENDKQDPLFRDFIENYLKKFKLLTRVELPKEWVLKHNANKSYDLGDGMVALEWNFNMKNSPEISLIFSKDSQDLKPFQLMDAPKGSSCNGIIGEQCKCGPFKITSPAGDVYANQAYELHHPNGVKKGCSDKDGNVEAVFSDITGECSVALLYDEDSKKMCAAK